MALIIYWFAIILWNKTFDIWAFGLWLFGFVQRFVSFGWEFVVTNYETTDTCWFFHSQLWFGSEIVIIIVNWWGPIQLWKLLNQIEIFDIFHTISFILSLWNIMMTIEGLLAIITLIKMSNRSLNCFLHKYIILAWRYWVNWNYV